MTGLDEGLEALAAAERLVAPSGLTLDHIGAMELLADGEGLPNSVVGTQLGLPAPTVTRLMGKLGALGMIRTAVDPSDLRRNVHRLDIQGYGVLFEVRKTLGAETLERGLALHRALGRTARAAGLSLRAVRVLAALGVREVAPAPRGATVGEIARAARLGQSTASMALLQLKQNMLVEEATPLSHADGRKRLYALTDQGKRLHDSLVRALELHQE